MIFLTSEFVPFSQRKGVVGQHMVITGQSQSGYVNFSHVIAFAFWFMHMQGMGTLRMPRPLTLCLMVPMVCGLDSFHMLPRVDITHLSFSWTIVTRMGILA